MFSKIRLICLVITASVITMVPRAETAFATGNKPEVSAQAAILMDQDSGRVLYEKNSHEKHLIASITKIMTALLAVESGEMDDKVTVSNRAYGKEGSSLYLKLGQTYPLKDIVYGLMLRSGNDAAVAIAEHVGGSLPGFTYMMNQKAREIGMLDSHFANPHGLNAEDHYSTAYDMALLTRDAMQNGNFKKLFGTKTYSADNPGEDWSYKWRNKNKLLFSYQYSTGGKTGYTKKAGRTLVSTAAKDGMHLIAVTLDDPDDWNDHKNLFNWGFNNFKETEIVERGRIRCGTLPENTGAFYAHRPLILPLTEKEREAITTSLDIYQEDPNGRAGDISVSLGDQKISTLSLYPQSENTGFWKSFSMLAADAFGWAQ